MQQSGHLALVPRARRQHEAADFGLHSCSASSFACLSRRRYRVQLRHPAVPGRIHGEFLQLLNIIATNVQYGPLVSAARRRRMPSEPFKWRRDKCFCYTRAAKVMRCWISDRWLAAFSSLHAWLARPKDVLIFFLSKSV